MEIDNREEILAAVNQLEKHGQYYLPTQDLSALQALLEFINEVLAVS